MAPEEAVIGTAGSGSAWVFGYGSLIWKQDFPYLESHPAYITGWARRFWQGSHDHRGVADDPGRVVTLVSAPGEVCAGRALRVEPGVFAHLDHREKNGYRRLATEIHVGASCVQGVVYFASDDNPAFLGPAPLADMACQIARCRGPSGTNREYLHNLADSLRRMGQDDPHVFALEAAVAALG